tara:strand:+ start:84 stop:1706 length:1623 start_codon:yes stop_codon:yes gene_type:complete
MAKEEKGLELTIPLPATEDKSMLDKIREGAGYYDKKITDAINYVTPPELRPILRGLEQIAPFQNLPKYDFNKPFKENIINMATDAGILGLDLATFGIGSAPSKIGLKVADEVAETAAKKTSKKKSIKKKDQISQSFENIAERLRTIDFDKLDLSSDEIFKIINEERVKQGLSEFVVPVGKTPDSSIVVKKLLDRDFIDQKTFDKIKDYGQRRYEFGVERGRDIAATTAKLNTKKQSDKAMELINKLQAEQDDPLLMTNEIFVDKLKKFAPDLFKKSYYTKKGTRISLINSLAEYNPKIKNFIAHPKQVNPETLTFALKKKREPRFQSQYNPALQQRLEYIKNIEDLYGNTLDGKSLRIIKAHALGEGRVKDLKAKDIVALEKKIKYIPEKNLDEVKNPSYFLTYSGNIKHRNIENALVNALVDKYQKLGYKFVDDAEMPWKKPDKEIDLSLSKNKELANEIKALNKKIDGFRSDLFKMDAYTLFYNPIKDKMVSYGKDISELPGLANIVTRVKKGDLELRDGGIVSIEEMIQPISSKYIS